MWGSLGCKRKFGSHRVYPIRLQSTVQKPLVPNASYGDGAPLFPGGWHETLNAFERASRSPKGSPMSSHRSDIVKQGRIFQFSLLKRCWGSPRAQPISPQLPGGHGRATHLWHTGWHAAARGAHTAQANCGA